MKTTDIISKSFDIKEKYKTKLKIPRLDSYYNFLFSVTDETLKIVLFSCVIDNETDFDFLETAIKIKLSETDLKIKEESFDDIFNSFNIDYLNELDKHNRTITLPFIFAKNSKSETTKLTQTICLFKDNEEQYTIDLNSYNNEEQEIEDIFKKDMIKMFKITEKEYVFVARLVGVKRVKKEKYESIYQKLIEYIEVK